ncbi:SpoIIAA family protein [Neolewinella litorea]|uniref:STAS/SEC14 domain-containing protein n=1 Tax=Neolewinella litorea TaxID=2562452 RepID=A0A4S4NKH5_9BACT|nr:STAS/SEC14 domain-containing protein [Neolewinella litorea]THH40376.1 STAS/SEC14 domain-containing protein [Neolewinella litorea]
MVTIFPLSQDNMLGFTLDGEVDDEGMRKLLMAVEAKVITHGKLRLLGNIKNVSGFASYQSFWNTIKTKKELLDKVEKYAILTDHGWLSTLSEGIDWLAPHMEVKTFRLNEGEVAHQWLRLDREEPSKVEAVKEIDLGDPRLLGLAIVGKLTTADYDRINLLVEEKVKHYGKARILLEVISTDGINARTLWEDLKTSLRLYKDLERVAIIGDQTWLKTSVKLSDLLTPGLDLAAFSTVERKRAIAWLD